MKWLVSALWIFVDLLFPYPTLLLRGERKRLEQKRADDLAAMANRVARLPDSSVEEYLAGCTQLLEEEQARRQSVEARLTTIMGLSSIAATIVFGGILAQVTGTVRAKGEFLQWMLMLGALYLTLQLCSAILAAVQGLSRRSYLAATPIDILPLPDEPGPVHRRRQISNRLTMLVENRPNNEAKVTQMAVAHRAIKNFLGGLLILALTASYQTPNIKRSDHLIENLGKCRELQELLCGAQAPSGIIGNGPKDQLPKSEPLPTPGETCDEKR